MTCPCLLPRINCSKLSSRRPDLCLLALWQVTHLSASMGCTRAAKSVARATVLEFERFAEDGIAVEFVVVCAAGEFFRVVGGIPNNVRTGRGMNSVRYFSPWVIFPP